MNLLGDNSVDAVVKGGGPYTPITQSYKTKVLTPCVIDGVNIITQKDLSDRNTKYVIKYDFFCKEETLNIPKGCIIEFDGGSISSGGYSTTVINFTDTILSFYGSIDDVLKEVELQGDYTVDVPGKANFATVAETANNIADKTNNTDGMGKIYLKKNKSIQEQMKQGNTIYVIQYDFDLGGKELVVPENCVLEFDGGMLKNGGVVGNNTILSNPLFKTITFNGNFKNDSSKASWFSSEDERNIIIDCIKLASYCNGNIADFEHIPLHFSGTIEIDSSIDVHWRNANFTFIPTRNYDVAFHFNSDIKWSGGNKSIKDSVFVSEQTNHKGVSCLHYDTWYNTNGAVWEDIKCDDFSGYFIVSSSYLQEATLTNIVCFGTAGFISYNSKKHYGNSIGSSNIIHISNCSCNGFANEDRHTGIESVIDLVDCMEVTFTNCVWQGQIADGKCVMSVSEYIGEANIYYNVIKLDGFWVEYPNYTNTESHIVINAPSALTFTPKRSTSSIHIKSSNVAIEFDSHDAFSNLSTLIDGIILDEGLHSVSISLDTAVYTSNGIDIAIIEKLITKGILIKFNNKVCRYEYSVRKEPSAHFKLDAINKVDGIAYMVQHYFPNHNNVDFKLIDVNNVPVLELSSESAQYSINPFLQRTLLNPTDTTFIVDAIYRVSPLDDKDDAVYAIPRFQYGENTTQVDKEIKSSEFSKWKREIFVISRPGNLLTPIILRNCKIQFAKLEYFANNAILSNDVFLNESDDNISSIYKNRTYFINKSADYKELIGKLQSRYVDIVTIYNSLYTYKNGYLSTYATTQAGNKRPTNIAKGFQYFDTTLNKPIWWTGEKWVDATGADVE